MDNFNELMNASFEKEKIQTKKDYEETTEDIWRERKEWLNGLTDWFRVPLNLLIAGILLIGAILMYMSIYMLTGNILVAALSPLLTELGILGWEISRERTKNTEKQTKIATFQRGWHIITSVMLLVTNFAIETAEQTLMIKVDGAIWLIFVVVGLTSFMDIVQFFRYTDADRDSTNKRNFQRKIEELKPETKEKQLDFWRIYLLRD